MQTHLNELSRCETPHTVYVPTNTRKQRSLWLNFHVQYIDYLFPTSQWFVLLAEHDDYNIGDGDGNGDVDGGNRITHCVCLDCPLTISLLCQPWQGEGKQLVVLKVTSYLLAVKIHLQGDLLFSLYVAQKVLAIYVHAHQPRIRPIPDSDVHWIKIPR